MTQQEKDLEAHVDTRTQTDRSLTASAVGS